MASNFSPCKGSYVLNQFQSILMFGILRTSHHGPPVFSINMKRNKSQSKSELDEFYMDTYKE